MAKRTFKGTKIACYIGYFVQAIINNLAPLLFVIFSDKYKIDLATIGSLIMLNFATQMAIDILSVKIIDKIGFKKITVCSHFLAFLGLVMLGILPELTSHHFLAIAVSIMVSAVGSGIIEVTISPIVESLPSDKKAADMSLLHSFYCWGQMLVVALSTVFIKLAGGDNWNILPIIWSVVPLINMFNFMSVPFMPPIEDDKIIPVKKLLKSKAFIVAMIIMFCAGASEIAMSQWSSFFAEEGLHVSKLMGDLLGPCLFAVLMGAGRLFYGLYGDKIDLVKIMSTLSILCIACYLTASLSNNSTVSLLACAVTGLSISLFWPGTFSLAAKRFPNGSGGLFGILALLGDIGCGTGPWLISFISSAYKSANPALSEGAALKSGLAYGCIFPIILIIGLIGLKKDTDKAENR